MIYQEEDRLHQLQKDFQGNMSIVGAALDSLIRDKEALRHNVTQLQQENKYLSYWVDRLREQNTLLLYMAIILAGVAVIALITAIAAIQKRRK